MLGEKTDEGQFSPGPSSETSKPRSGYVYEEDGMPLFQLNNFECKLDRTHDFARVEDMTHFSIYCAGDVTKHRDVGSSASGGSFLTSPKHAATMAAGRMRKSTHMTEWSWDFEPGREGIWAKTAKSWFWLRSPSARYAPFYVELSAKVRLLVPLVAALGRGEEPPLGLLGLGGGVGAGGGGGGDGGGLLRKYGGEVLKVLGEQHDWGRIPESMFGTRF